MPNEAEGLCPIWADLHIHTVVSPCADVEMIPPLIIRRARELGLGLIAITDHNTAENAGAVQRAAIGSGVAVLPGMELHTREDAHVLCLFQNLEQALAWQAVVYANLPSLNNSEEVFGSQYVVDETGDYLYTNSRLLLASTALGVEEAVAGIQEHGGLAIAAHVDRQAYSLVANLGFVPQGLNLAALEVRSPPNAEATGLLPPLRDYPLIMSGDAHRLAEMRASLLLVVKEPTLSELALALKGDLGRKAKLLP